MKIGSDCSGPCVVCISSGGCLAGHGDDDFEVMSEEELKKMLLTEIHPNQKRDLSWDEIKIVEEWYLKS